ncbi:MAG: hypothetical protein QXU32_02220 [Nitrososphaerales archaeon]
MHRPIGKNNGLEAARIRSLALDPGRSWPNILYGEPGKKYPEAPKVAVEGTLRKLIEGHNHQIKVNGKIQDLAKRLAELEKLVKERPF